MVASSSPVEHGFPHKGINGVMASGFIQSW